MPQELFGHNIKELQDIIRVFGHAMDVVSRSTNNNARAATLCRKVCWLNGEDEDQRTQFAAHS
jgi:hypothetical protein